MSIVDLELDEALTRELEELAADVAAFEEISLEDAVDRLRAQLIGAPTPGEIVASFVSLDGTASYRFGDGHVVNTGGEIDTEAGR